MTSSLDCFKCELIATIAHIARDLIKEAVDSKFAKTITASLRHVNSNIARNGIHKHNKNVPELVA